MSDDDPALRELARHLFGEPGSEPTSDATTGTGNHVPREGDNPRQSPAYRPGLEWLEELFNPPDPQ